MTLNIKVVGLASSSSASAMRYGTCGKGTNYYKLPHCWRSDANLEVLMLRFAQFANNCFEKNETTIQNLQALVQNLETQIGQIDKALLERLLGTSHRLTLFLG